jgi:hypothetical protein
MMRGVTLHQGQSPGPSCCARPWSFGRGREALYPEYWWTLQGVDLQICRTSVPTSENTIPTAR